MKLAFKLVCFIMLSACQTDKQQVRTDTVPISNINSVPAETAKLCKGMVSVTEKTSCKLESFEVPEKSAVIIHCAGAVQAESVSIRVHTNGCLWIDANRIEVLTSLSIDGRGDDGAAGTSTPNTKPDWSSQGDADFWAARRDCESNVNHPDRGSPGKPGSDGRKGATLILPTDVKGGSFSLDRRGGRGGAGGPGQPGRLLRNGRNNYCDGCLFNCPAGAQGNPGADGAIGDVFRT